MNKINKLFQEFLWLISGNEVWLIKESRTAHKYYSRQGLLFVMTFVFAAFSGGFAGYDFGKSIYSAIFFGFIWGFLVYAIDQMMIQTIDKVYVSKISLREKFWKFFFPRLFLGALLAMFMSSPLDHFLFREQINYQMQKNADSVWMAYKKKLVDATGIKNTEKMKNEYQLLQDSLSNERMKEPKTSIFKEAKTKHENLVLEISQKKADLNNAKKNYLNAWARIPQTYDTLTKTFKKNRNSNEYRIYISKRKLFNIINKEYINKKKELSHLDSIMHHERKMYLEEINTKIKNQDTMISKLNNKINNDTKLIENETDRKKEFVKNMQGFDTKFMTLLTHPNFGVQFLRWFIFIVFLLIEILPTWMKLMGNPTEYDYKLALIKNKRIKDYKTEIEKETKIAEIYKNKELELVDEKENLRKQNELDLHKKILNKIVDKYENISDSILNEWEKELRNK